MTEHQEDVGLYPRKLPRLIHLLTPTPTASIVSPDIRPDESVQKAQRPPAEARGPCQARIR